MSKFSHNSPAGNFTLTEHVLLFFNEHDSRIALDWESDKPKYRGGNYVTILPEALKL